MRFATEFQAGNVQPTYKGVPESQIPKTNSTVTELVRDNFDRIVHDHSNDVFVYFSASKEEEKTETHTEWQKYSEVLKDVPNLVFAHFDTLKNELNHLHF